jgi:hypothetical protein
MAASAIIRKTRVFLVFVCVRTVADHREIILLKRLAMKFVTVFE